MKLSEQMQEEMENESTWLDPVWFPPGWIVEATQLEEENEALRHGRDRWHRRWGIAFDILDTTQMRQYEEEIDCPAREAR